MTKDLEARGIRNEKALTGVAPVSAFPIGYVAPSPAWARARATEGHHSRLVLRGSPQGIPQGDDASLPLSTLRIPPTLESSHDDGGSVYRTNRKPDAS